MSNDSFKPELCATALDARGFGIALHNDTEYYVSDLLPGESATVQPVHKNTQKKRVWASISERTSSPSPQRQPPACQAFGQCGGCVWQHLSLKGQSEEKHKRVESSLRAHLGHGCPPIRPVIQSPKEYGYRNKSSYVIADVDGKTSLGAYKARTHEFVSTLGCAIIKTEIDALAKTLQVALREELELCTYAPTTKLGHLRYALIRHGRGVVDNHLVLVGSSSTPEASLAPFAASLIQRGFKGVSFCTNDSEHGVILTGDIKHLAGERHIEETLSNIDIRLDPTSFWQVNSEQAEILYQHTLALADIQKGDRALDLYCGVGGFAFHLAQAGAVVHGVERHAPAIDVAKRTAKRHGLSIHFQCGDAKAASSSHFNTIIVNPPRKGLDRATLGHLLLSNAPTLMYVSCNPESLARDLEHLTQEKYAIEVIQPIDLMPGTPHIETIVKLRSV